MKVSAKICGYSFLLSLCATLFCAPALGGQDDIVRIDSNLVNLFFSVLGKDGFSTSLTRTDIKVFEDGQQQNISLFQHETDRPLAIAILIDTSGSVKRGLSLQQAASKSFIDAVLQTESDQVAVVSFAADPFLEQPFTNNREAAKRVVDRVKSMVGRGAYAGNGTILPVGVKPAEGSLSFTSAIWDAAWITCRHVLSEMPMGTRKIIVVLTDGEDTSSRANLDETIEIAIKSDTVIYAIGVGDTSLADVNKNTLKDLTFRTGGQLFLPKKEEELNRAFERISEELHSQYLLTYVPTNRSKSQPYRQVRIEMSNPQLRKQRLRLIYRYGYYFRGS